MSKLDQRHPEQGDLLLYLDGELPGGKSRQVRSHLEACWQCRAEVEDLESVISECVKYRKEVLAPRMPFPPAEWGNLNFELVEAELASQSLLVRVARFFSPRRPAFRWALSGALAVALCFVLIWQLRETPRVEAAALLQRAATAAGKNQATRPNSHRRLRITTRTGQITRLLGVAYKPKAQEAEVARLFDAAHYDWNNPLTAQAYIAWRAQLAHFDDAVAPEPNSYDIKTTTQDGEMVSATLKLRSSDLEPLEGRFEFRNHDWVELTELVDQQTNPASTVAGTTGGMSRQPNMPPAPLRASPEPAAPAFSEELQVVSALHRLGADLDDPIEIARQGSQVMVSGAGIAPKRQQQLHAALDRLPHVALRFEDPISPASAAPAVSDPAVRDAAGTERSLQAVKIEESLGGRPQFERFSNSVLDWTESAMTRAYALRRLAQQFPIEAENQMSVEDRRTLRKIAREHLGAFVKDAQRVTNTVNPVLSGMGAAPSRADLSEVANWQAASEELLAVAGRAEKQLAMVLGMTPVEGIQTNSLSQLVASLTQQSARAEQCARLLEK